MSEKARLHVVYSLLCTTVAVWVDGRVTQAWDFKSGETVSENFGWLMTLQAAQEMGVSVSEQHQKGESK